MEPARRRNSGGLSTHAPCPVRQCHPKTAGAFYGVCRREHDPGIVHGRDLGLEEAGRKEGCQNRAQSCAKPLGKRGREAFAIGLGAGQQDRDAWCGLSRHVQGVTCQIPLTQRQP